MNTKGETNKMGAKALGLAGITYAVMTFGGNLVAEATGDRDWDETLDLTAPIAALAIAGVGMRREGSRESRNLEKTAYLGAAGADFARQLGEYQGSMHWPGAVEQRYDALHGIVENATGIGDPHWAAAGMAFGTTGLLYTLFMAKQSTGDA